MEVHSNYWFVAVQKSREDNISISLITVYLCFLSVLQDSSLCSLGICFLFFIIPPFPYNMAQSATIFPSLPPVCIRLLFIAYSFTFSLQINTTSLQCYRFTVHELITDSKEKQNKTKNLITVTIMSIWKNKTHSSYPGLSTTT